MPSENSSATESFLKFAFGFLLFIGLSIGITYVVNTYTAQQTAAANQAAALQALIGNKQTR
jgi:hypothetical protein